MVLVSRMRPSGRLTQSVALASGALPSGARLVVVELGQRQRQLAFGNDLVLVAVPDDGKRLAPIALAGEEPVAQLVLDAARAELLFLQPVDHLRLGLGGGQAVEETGIDGDALAGERRAGAVSLVAQAAARTASDSTTSMIGRSNFTREFVIALVVRGHGHDRAGAVAHQHVVGDPDRDLLAVDRIDRVGAGEDAGLALGESVRSRSLLFATSALYFCDGLALLGRGEFLDQRMLGREHHVGRAEERVGPRGEDGELSSSGCSPSPVPTRPA